MSETQPDTTKQKFLREEYRSRINQVIDYIEKNIDKDLLLEDLARVAHFSPFHFHRIFGAMLGETLNQFIQRIRIEKAAVKLINQPKKSITEIAFDCGFSGSATFARAFKAAFGISASQWRNGRNLDESKIGKIESNDDQHADKIGKAFEISSSYIGGVNFNQIWRIKMKTKPRLEANVEVREMPEIHVAYIRHIGPYKGDAELFRKLFEKLLKWAGPRGLLQFPETRMLTLYYDDLNITDESKLRMDVCITVPPDTPVDGEIGKTTIRAGKYAFAHFEIGVNEYEDAWNAVFGGWLPESGYQPEDGPCYELYHNNPEEHPEHKQIVDICVPVKPL
jgi:AraC family transcriptional regulator